MIKKAYKISVTDAKDLLSMTEAELLRKEIARLRITHNNLRKDLKEPYLNGAKVIQEEFNAFEKIAKEAEAYLLKQENFISLQYAKPDPAANDSEKLRKIAESIRKMKMPDFETDFAKQVFRKMIAEMVMSVDSAANLVGGAK